MRQATAATLLVLTTATCLADGVLPPRPELLGVKAVSLDVQVLVGEHGNPAFSITPELADPLLAPVTSVLAEGGITSSTDERGSVPRFQLWIQVVRSKAAPGALAVSVEASLADVVRLKRLPKVVPVYPATLWNRSSVDLIAEGDLLGHLIAEATSAARSLVADVRYARAGVSTTRLE